MRIKMLGALLLGAAISVLLLFIVNLSVNGYISKVYLSEQKKAERDNRYKLDLQDYVIDNRLSSNDTAKIAEWAQDNKYLYVLMFKDDRLLFESGSYGDENGSEMGENKENADDNTGETGNNDATDDSQETSEGQGGSSGITVKPPTREELIANAVAGGSYPIYMTDGVILVSMADYTEYLYYDIANIVSVVVALATFIVIMWCYFYSITKRIGRLGKEVTHIAEGDMRYPIAVSGEDEITRLAMDVEYMRSSMLENLEKEHSALESNRELITAMSHDIRTPLTVLLGYIDIMKMNAPEGAMAEYLDASEKTALRLKKMSDDMFNYFLAYGGSVGVEVQECNARTLVEQMISGHVFLLREQGYTIDYSFEEESGEFLDDVVLVTDPPQLMRIVENLFSNVMKYADPTKPVSVFIGSETDEMTIKVSNYVSKNIDEAQKNGIGLRSCMKLANAMDIRFSIDEDGDVYTSVLNVPIVPDIAYGEFETTDEEKRIIKWWKFILGKLRIFWEKISTASRSLISRVREKLSRKK